MRLNRILTVALIGICLLAVPLAPAAVTDAVAECSATSADEIFSTDLEGYPWCSCEPGTGDCPYYCRPPK